jgi:hypothetical protein
MLLDSRSRTVGSTPSRAHFNIIKSLRGVKKARVKSVMFVNTFDNITPDNNELKTSSGTASIPAGYYSGTQFLIELQTALESVFGVGGAPYVTFDSINNNLIWTLGANEISGSSSLSTVLGLNETQQMYTGSFTTRLFLALPTYVSFTIPQLSSVRTVHAGYDSKENFQPFCTVPVTSSYLGLDTYQQDYERVIELTSNNNGTSISAMDVIVQDAYTGREITEITNWSMLLEFY